MQRKFVLLLIAGVLAWLAFVPMPLGEPTYHGRSLSSWVKQARGESWGSRAEAQRALQAIGIEKALPHLLELANARPGRICSWLIAHPEWVYTWMPYSVCDCRTAHEEAVQSFEAFGTNAAAAVPQLTALLGGTNQSDVIARCLGAIGPPAQASVLAALTNADPRMREFALMELKSVTPDSGTYLRYLQAAANDPVDWVQRTAVEGLKAELSANLM